MLVGIRPGDALYVNHSGAVFHPQDEDDQETLGYYEIQNTSDFIEFNISDRITGFDTPVMALYTQWGSTDFNIVDVVDQEVIISEQSGYDTDNWFVQLQGTSGQYQITQFDTGAGVDGTQAAWLPYVGVFNAEA